MWSTWFPCLVSIASILQQTKGELVITTDGGTFYDDFTYTETPTTSSVTTWGDTETLDGTNYKSLNKLTTCTSGACGAGSQMWGMYDTALSPYLSALARSFSCSRESVVTWGVDIYVTGTSTNADSVTVVRSASPYLAAGGETGSFNQALLFDGTFTATDAASNGYTNMRRYQFTDSFPVKPLDYFTISLRPELSNGRRVVWNNFRVTCTLRPTSAPTYAPTSPTKTPTKSPTDFPSETPTKAPTPAPTANPTKAPTTDRPTQPPTTPIPSKSPSPNPTTDPTRAPTTDPTEQPTERPTQPTPKPSESPTRSKANIVQKIDQAFGGNGGDPNYSCDASWTECHTEVLIIIIVIVIVLALYWVVGGVWYRHRQNNRPLPPQRGVEMADADGDAVDTHATSNKWKSAWEIEQENQRMAEAAGANQGGGW